MAKAAGRRSSRFPVTDGAASCGGAEETAPSSGSCLWGLSRNDPPHPASCPEAAWTARSVTGQVLFLRPRRDDVLKAERAGGCTWSPPAHRPFLASSLRSISRCKEGTQMHHCALLVSSAHHKRSTGGRYNNGKHLDKGREKAAALQFTPVALPARDGFNSALIPNKSFARMRLRKAFPEDRKSTR